MLFPQSKYVAYIPFHGRLYTCCRGGGVSSAPIFFSTCIFRGVKNKKSSVITEDFLWVTSGIRTHDIQNHKFS